MDQGAQLGSEALFHVRAGISLIFGLSLTHLLRGVVRMVQHPERKPVYFVHLAWVVSSFLLVVHFWWGEVNIVIITHWNFARYFFLISYSCLFYFLCVLLFPDELGEHTEYRAYYLAERKWIFGVLAVITFADVFDTLLKGTGHLADLGPEYLVSTFVRLAAYLVAMFVRNERYHAALVTANLIYQASWMLRVYNF